MPSDLVAIAPLRRAAVLQRLHTVAEQQAYMELRLATLCQAIGTRPRTLYSYCNANFGMGPIRYLHTWRLQLAHEALHRSDPAETTVTAIAMHYGFTELGRFAAE